MVGTTATGVPRLAYTTSAPTGVLVLGRPGSGKGTQVRLLEPLGLLPLDFGQARREAVAMGTPVGRRVAALGDLLSRGAFFDDDLAAAVFADMLERERARGHAAFALDGFPRNVAQIELLKQHSREQLGAALRVPLALVLHAPFETLLSRTDGRLIHKASGRTYHPVECPPRVPMRDDVTGEPLEVRALSSAMSAPEALRARCDIEAREIDPLVAHLEASPDTEVLHMDRDRDAAWFRENRKHPRQLHGEIVAALRRRGLIQEGGAEGTRAIKLGSRRSFSTSPGRTATACSPLQHVGVVGLGPHARRIYYPMLQELAARTGLRIPIVVDLEDQRALVESHVARHSPHARPGALVFAPTEHRRDDTVHPSVARQLGELAGAGKLDGLIIASEPSSHEPYLRWALAHGIDAFVDKPPTLPAPFDPAAVVSEFEEVVRLAETSASNVMVCVQRRAHMGYQLVHRVVSDVVATWGVPVSYIDIYHADGMWCMPGELVERESHPYKYGYGKLMHSGYHFVDLLVWLQAINDDALPLKAGSGSVDLTARSFGAPDLVHQKTHQDLRILTGASDADVLASMTQYAAAAGSHAGVTGAVDATGSGLGELNVHALMQFLHTRGGDPDSDTDGGSDHLLADDGAGGSSAAGATRVVCTASLNLLQNSFSRRAWFHPRPDVYKGNGRVRHERLVVNVGNLLSVHVHSYQSHEVGQPDTNDAGASSPSPATAAALAEVGLDASELPTSSRTSCDGYGEGHEEHFDVCIYRNAGVIGGPAFERIPVGDIMRRQAAAGRLGAHPAAIDALRDLGLSLGHNEYGRFAMVQDWAARRSSPGASPLAAQRDTMVMLGRLCEALRAATQSPRAPLRRRRRRRGRRRA